MGVGTVEGYDAVFGFKRTWSAARTCSGKHDENKRED